MKKLLLISLTCFATTMYGADVPQPKAETPASTAAPARYELRAPYNSMTTVEAAETGIQKLSPSEQEALSSWFCKQKHHPKLSVSKEVPLTAIQESGKYLVLGDGTRLSLSKSSRKKISKWSVGDKIGIGESGRRGSLTIYHMATGQKVKVTRDQTPEKKSEKQ